MRCTILILAPATLEIFASASTEHGLTAAPAAYDLNFEGVSNYGLLLTFKPAGLLWDVANNRLIASNVPDNGTESAFIDVTPGTGNNTMLLDGGGNPGPGGLSVVALTDVEGIGFFEAVLVPEPSSALLLTGALALLGLRRRRRLV